jgi:hypothetical protein
LGGKVRGRKKLSDTENEPLIQQTYIFTHFFLSSLREEEWMESWSEYGMLHCVVRRRMHKASILDTDGNYL